MPTPPILLPPFFCFPYLALIITEVQACRSTVFQDKNTLPLIMLFCYLLMKAAAPPPLWHAAVTGFLAFPRRLLFFHQL